MADACPVPQPGDPLVQSLTGSVDCHVQALVQFGYDALLAPGGALAGLLTAGLTLYVALIGYRLMRGRGALSASEFAISAVKIGAVLALATQWPLYEHVVYDLLFRGPEQLADGLARAAGAKTGGDGLLGALQHAVDTLSIFSPDAPPGPNHHDPRAGASLPSSLPQHMTPAGFDAELFLVSAFLLLLTTLGVLLTAKIVLGLLLALGPLFIGLFLFDATRGVFEGWLRASLGSALLPLLATAAIALALTFLGPSLAQIEQMNDTDTYIPGVGLQVVMIVLVILLATGGLLVAAGVTAFAFRLPTRRRADAPGPSASASAAPAAAPAALSRADRVGAALAAQDRTRITLASASASSARGSSGVETGGSGPQGRRTSETIRRTVRPSGRGPRRG